MKREVADALEASIAHWDENAGVKTPRNLSIGWRACALCLMFNRKSHQIDGTSCFGCPVFGRTGRTLCEKSPYERACRSRDRWLEDTSSDERARKFSEDAIAERDFLASLREPIDEDAQ